MMTRLSDMTTRQRNTRSRDALFACVVVLATILGAIAIGTAANAASTGSATTADTQSAEMTSPDEQITGGALDADLTDLPAAFTECGGTPNDPSSVLIDDTSPQAVYSAPWKAETPGLWLYQGTQHITNIGGHKVSHTFNTPGGGPSTFSYGYRKMRNAGKAAVYWDGQYFSTVSLYAPDNEYHCEFTFYDMPPGVHTVMVKVLNQQDPASGGTYVNLDYFRRYDF